MDWVKLLTDFEGHPKVLSVGLAGDGLYARALAYCGKYETDGAIPEAWVEQAVAREGLHDLPDRLVEIGLWKRDESGYEITDFTEVNRSKEQMDSLRESRSIAGKEGVEAKRKQKLSKSHSYSNSEFSSWLEHYRATTGKTKVRGSKPAFDSFLARRRDGLTLDDLKLATVGCHSDGFCREHGHDVPETILRASKVTRYIELGRKPKAKQAVDRSRYDEGVIEVQA